MKGGVPVASANMAVLYTLGQRVREDRLRQGKSLTEVSVAIGYDKSNLSKIERGLKTPELDTLRKMADELDTPLGAWFRPVKPESSNISRMLDFMTANRERINKLSPEQLAGMQIIMEQTLSVAGV